VRRGDAEGKARAPGEKKNHREEGREGEEDERREKGRER